MHHLFRLRLSRLLHQLSLLKDSLLEVHGEAQESQTGARCCANPPPPDAVRRVERSSAQSRVMSEARAGLRHIAENDVSV